MTKQTYSFLLTASCAFLIGVALGNPALTLPGVAKSDDKKSETAAKELNLQCPKCNSQMDFGVPVYFNEGYYVQVEWAASAKPTHIFQKAEPRTKIVSYRCTECGYLESYAK